MHDFVRGIKAKDLVEGRRLDLLLSMFAVYCLKELNWAVDGYLVWYRYEFGTGVVRGVSSYRRHRREFPKSNPGSRAGITTLIIERAVEDLECARQRPVIRSQPVAHKSKKKDADVALVWDPVPAWGALAVSEEKCGPSLTVVTRDLQNLERSMVSDLIAIWKELQQQMWAFKR